MYFFRSWTFLGAGILENSHFSEKLLLRNQVHNRYTWKNFPLTSIHSFDYTLIWFGFELPQSFIVKNSKQCINFIGGCATNVIF